ncbi:hypothetical protein [Adhaeribacter pallidiroseus]|uniref:DUF3471 domain-containing protein n=1 Tax=Adhaeribacter pallidiroseus TaxID=2072847 RepID=A0A369QH88_9BACT|nr:hypothetical protein [Adhaeribacter pallidiroseus]RDC61648.1 hypothetical protein AHMF7616_00228 [Adhaeribacter pallidiroseus]
MKKIILTGICAFALSTTFAFVPQALTSASSKLVVVDDPMDLNQYIGKYKFEGLPFEYLTITLINGKLHANTGAEEGDLIPLPEADTFDASGRAILKFKRDTDKKVNGMTLDADGSSFEGKKEA